MRLTPDAAPGAAFAAAIDRLRPPEPWALAVSGGPDSTALMLLAADFQTRRGGPPPTALTVDHGLRPEAADEAARVAAAARRLGLKAEILSWTGDKPVSGVQAAARRARYRLLGEACARAGLKALMTGHTLDDQIETATMRAGKGSGPAGLAGMASQTTMTDGQVRLVRPLIWARKAALTGWLDAIGADYVRDPSNENPRFERARLRAEGAWLDQAAVAAAQRARIAAEREAAAWLDAHARETGGAALTPRGLWRALPDAAAGAALAAMLRRAGGREHPGSRAERARLLAALRGTEPLPGRTLAGALVRAARRAEAGGMADAVAFRPEKAGGRLAMDYWLPFGRFPQILADEDFINNV